MAESVPDLSRLRINREEHDPSPARGRRVAITAAILFAVAGAAWWFTRAGPVVVTVAIAEVTGGASGGSSVGLTANGYVVARTKASVSSKVTGRLEYLGVAEGSRVTKGEIIARIENRDVIASVSRAEADVATAKYQLVEAVAQRDQLQRDLARAQSLREKDLGSQASVEDVTAQLAQANARVDTRQAQVQSAQSGLEVAKANFENTLIRAPFSGTVLRKDAEVGEVVAPVATGTGLTRGAVVTMANLETLEVEVDVNEAYIGQLHPNQGAVIVLDAYPDQRWKGSIRQIVPTADRQKATVQVKVGILDHDPRILSEMGARVEFLQAKDSTSTAPTSRIFVPSDAVRNEAGTTIVWMVRGGRLSRRVVDAGPVSGGRREIRTGLTGGEQVLLTGPETPRDGMAVTIGSSPQQ